MSLRSQTLFCQPAPLARPLAEPSLKESIAQQILRDAFGIQFVSSGPGLNFKFFNSQILEKRSALSALSVFVYAHCRTWPKSQISNLNAAGIAKTLSVVAPAARADKRESESEAANLK